MSNPDETSILGDPLEVGARLSRGPAARMVDTAFAMELDGQRDLQREIGLADLAHTVMSIESGVIPRESGRALLKVLLALQSGAELPLDAALGDLYTNREAWIAERTPAVGWLGAGRARREATTIAWQLAVRDRLLALAGALVGCGAALTRRGASMRDVLAPDYTYLQAGQPSTFGHYLLSFAFPMLRDLDRVRAVHGRVDRSPAGCGSANGSALPQDRDRLCALLGFREPVDHARDAMWQSDLPIECMAAIVAAIVNLDRLAEDLLYFCSTDVGLVQLSDAHARASKILPHKRNPYALTYVRALANRMIGVQASLAAAGRTPSGQIDNRTLAYGEVVRALDAAAGAAWLMADVIDSITVDTVRAQQRLAEGFTASTDLSEMFVQEARLDYRSAQRLVGHLARELSEAGRPLVSLTTADIAGVTERCLGAAVVVSAASLARALDPRAAVGARRGAGGAAADAVDAMVATCTESLRLHEAWRAETVMRHAASRDLLLVASQALAEGAR